MQVHPYMCECVERPEVNLQVLSNFLFLFFLIFVFETESLTSLELTKEGRVTGQ